MYIWLICCLFTGVIAQSDSSKCCTDGIALGRKVFSSDFIAGSCDKDLNGRDLFCKILSKQCCEHAIKDSYCSVGKSLSLAGVTCMKADTEVKEYRDIQESCCQCCKDGHRAGIFQRSCTLPFAENEYCSVSFKTCCEQAKKKPGQPLTTEMSPTTTTTTTTTTEPSPKQKPSPLVDIASKPKPTLRIFGKRCEEVQCDRASSTGCFYEDNRIAKCKCKQGFKNHGRFVCKALDKCHTRQNRCLKQYYCMEVRGVPRCYQNCPTPRYKATYLADGTKICEDVDECAFGLSKCNLNRQDCVNLFGGYKCKNARCDKGLKLVNDRCVDIDECNESKNVCGEGRCENYFGGYYCECFEGYRSDSKTNTCVDFNECESTTRQYCDYNCVNKVGGYECSCPKGYRLMGEDCVDINECEKTPNVCSEGNYCFNTYGSYICIPQTCPDSEYYLQKPVKDEPDSCSKVCSELTLEEKKLMCQLGRTPQSIKRITYKYEKEIAIEGFYYDYWWNFPRDKYDVIVSLVSGHVNGQFKIRKTGPNSIKLLNVKPVHGPRRFKMIMHMDVKEKVAGRPLRWRYVTNFYVDVSEHNFSWR